MELEAQLNMNLIFLKAQINALKSTLTNDQLVTYKETMATLWESQFGTFPDKSSQIYLASLDLFQREIQ